jgi:hypothetical protein
MRDASRNRANAHADAHAAGVVRFGGLADYLARMYLQLAAVEDGNCKPNSRDANRAAVVAMATLTDKFKSNRATQRRLSLARNFTARCYDTERVTSCGIEAGSRFAPQPACAR